MTGRERLAAVFAGKRPDHTPFAPLIGRYYVKSLPAMGIPLERIAPWERAVTPALRRGLNMHEVETIRFIGADVLYRHVNACRVVYDAPVKPYESEENGVMTSGFSTPWGDIWEEVRELHGTEYISRRMLQGQEDLEVYLKVLSSARVEPAYDEPREMDAFIGEDGMITLTGPVTPLQEMLQFRMGVEQTAYALADYPDLIMEVFEALQGLNIGIYRILAEAPAEVVITYEDTSTTVMGPQWYRDFCMSELDSYADIIRSSAKTYLVHMCGRISALTELIASGRMDGIDSVCPPETGDIEPGDACRRLGKLVVGGLDPAALVSMTPDACRRYAAQKLAQIPADAPFILSTGDSTAALTPVENLQAISRLVREHPSAAGVRA